jgi:trehalose 6-phosphate phosphatase
MSDGTAAILAAARTARSRLLISDYDGTLAPFTADRDHADPYPGVAGLLARIAAGTATRVVVVTGRGAGAIRRLLPLDPPLEVWGLHGRERLRPDGRRDRWPVSDRARRGLAEAATWARGQGLANELEEKDGSLAFHFRGHGERRAGAALATRITDSLRPIAVAAGLVIRPMDLGLEVREAGRDKGDAVTTLLAESGSDTFAIYLGDDDTDEDAFAAIAGRGVGILVAEARRETRASEWLERPAGVLALLRGWAEIEGP